MRHDDLSEKLLNHIQEAGHGVWFHAAWRVASIAGHEGERQVGRALQKLRKAGLIHFNSKTGWHPGPKER